MKRTKILEKAIENVIYSGYLKNERPLSLLIISNPESGKTEVLKKFIVNKGLVYKSDFTAYGLMKDIIPLIAKGEVRHIICPDLLRPFSRRQSIVKELITFLNGLIEDGIINVSTYFSPQTFLTTEDKIKNLKCGLIGALTKDAFFENLKLWKSVGFLSRAIPFTYSYSQSDVVDILESIISEEYHKEKTIKLEKLPKKDKKVELNLNLAQRLLPYTFRYAQVCNSYGFRFQKQLQVLLKANALSRGDNKTTEEDFEQVVKILDYVNFDFGPLK